MLPALKQEIDARVAAYFASTEVRMGLGLSPNGVHALELLGEFTGRPSKRLRGVLAITAYEMFGGTIHAAALDLALAMELAQSYLLIIDDVMDHSPTRRGGPTVHREYRERWQTAKTSPAAMKFVASSRAVEWAKCTRRSIRRCAKRLR